MKLTVRLVNILLVVFGNLTLPFWLEAASYQCQKATEKITIDGKLSESDWKKAPVIQLRDILTGKPALLNSEVRLLWDDNFFYLGFVFQEPNVWATVDLKRRYGAPFVSARSELEIMGSDCFAKLFLDPDADGRNYVEFHINPLNSVFDAFFTTGKNALQVEPGDRLFLHQWQCPGLLSAVHIQGTLNDFTDQDTNWSAELAIPFSSLKPFLRSFPVKPGDIWKVHLGRVWRKGPYSERYYWTWPVMGIVECHIPSKWQTIEFVSGSSQKKEKIWRGGWSAAWKDQEQLLSVAKKLGFSALMINAPASYLNELIPKARAQGVEIYYWFNILGQKENQDWWQKVSPEEEEKARRIKEDKTPGRYPYQFGGEPVSSQHDVDINEFLCFHRQEVVAWCEEKLADVIKKSPGLSGIAFDYFGYKNYRGCRCPVSEKLFADYYTKSLKEKIDREKAWEQFSLDTLVDFYHTLIEYLQSISPSLKFVTHIYPTFLPDPVYGNRLNLDYCCQTVAWYFEPFWPLEKVKQYTRIVGEKEKDYYCRPQGIPFVGIYLDRPGISKPVERFRQELKAVREAGSRSLSICPFTIFLQHPELIDVVLEELGPGEEKNE